MFGKMFNNKPVQLQSEETESTPSWLDRARERMTQLAAVAATMLAGVTIATSGVTPQALQQAPAPDAGNLAEKTELPSISAAQLRQEVMDSFKSSSTNTIKSADPISQQVIAEHRQESLNIAKARDAESHKDIAMLNATAANDIASIRNQNGGKGGYQFSDTDVASAPAIASNTNRNAGITI